MYDVRLTEGEIRAIISAYDNANHYLEDICTDWDCVHKKNIVSETLDPAQLHIKSRINYLMSKLDTGC